MLEPPATVPLVLSAASAKLAAPPAPGARPASALPAERGGPTGPEPTRFGDWERAGRCIDF